MFVGSRKIGCVIFDVNFRFFILFEKVTNYFPFDFLLTIYLKVNGVHS